jgi:dTDP-4-dehydrorhamnose 3,5-epimerase-like enzyme
MNKNPYLISFPKIGNSQMGFISVCENENLPFQAKRFYWTFSTPEKIVRGHHAHLQLEQILIAVSGTIHLNIELLDGEKFEFILNKPNVGVFIPKMAWHTMEYHDKAVQVCIANMEYDENDYIRSYEKFKQLGNGI